MTKLVTKTMLAALCMMAISCTKSPEKQVISSLNEQYSSKVIAEKLKVDMDKLFGAKDTKFKNSVTQYIVDNTKITFSDVKITENTATVKVLAEQPDDNTLGGMMLLVAFADPKKVENMTMQEFFDEANKGDPKRKAASVNDIQINKFEGTFNLKKDNEQWVLAEKKDNFFAKKYLVKNTK